jgi:hypothetical protein
MGIGLGANLLGGAISNASQRRAFKGYKPQSYDTSMYDSLENDIRGANFDNPLYEAFQNSQRGAAMQNQRIYAQQGNSALAADRTAADRRGAEGGLFSGVMQNNLNRMGMLGNIADKRSQIGMANTDMQNQNSMNMANMRAQTGFGSLLGNTISGAGAMFSNQMMNQFDRKNMLADRKDWMAHNMDVAKMFGQGRNSMIGSSLAGALGNYGNVNFGDGAINQLYQREGQGAGMFSGGMSRTSSGRGYGMPRMFGLGL